MADSNPDVLTYEIQIELETGYTIHALEAAYSADEARENLFRKFHEMGWRPGKQFVLSAPVAVDVNRIALVTKADLEAHGDKVLDDVWADLTRNA